MPETDRARPCQDGPHNQTSPDDTIRVAAGVLQQAADLIGTQAERERQVARRNFNEGLTLGLDLGDGRGYARAHRELEQIWRDAARPVAHGTPYADLERRRWGPGGREHFADPRPGDYPGREGGA